MEMMFNGRVDCLIDRLYDEAKDAARVGGNARARSNKDG